MLALGCLLFRELEASQLRFPGHCFGLEMSVPDLALLCYQLVLLPSLHLGHQLSSVWAQKCSKTGFCLSGFFFVLFWCCCCADLLYTLLKHFAPESSLAKRAEFFPPRTVCARDTESQIPQVWGLCQLCLHTDRGSCSRSTFSNCYFISICFIASQCQGLFLAMTSHPCLWKATQHKEKEGGNNPDICCYNWSMWEASSLQHPRAQSDHQGLIQALSSG